MDNGVGAYRVFHRKPVGRRTIAQKLRGAIVATRNSSNVAAVNTAQMLVATLSTCSGSRLEVVVIIWCALRLHYVFQRLLRTAFAGPLNTSGTKINGFGSHPSWTRERDVTSGTQTGTTAYG